MIGEHLYKYTRRVMGNGISEKRHRRFVGAVPLYSVLSMLTKSDSSGSIHTLAPCIGPTRTLERREPMRTRPRAVRSIPICHDFLN